MEIIEVPGYTRTEKMHIAEQFLVPKQLRDHGLTDEQLEITREGIELVIDHYTREAGVRGLEREIAALCRHAAVQLTDRKHGAEVAAGVHTTAEYVEQVLGIQKYRPELAERKLSPGVATGLSVNNAGGDLLFIEATRMMGKGKIHVTGNLRSVMKESAATAVSYVRSRADRLQLDPEWLKTSDLHVHIPKARAARDAAGAGLTMFVAVTSLLLGVPARPEVAVAGEMTLRGRVLPVSDVKAKILAAHRAGIKIIVLPEGNRNDVQEVPSEVLDDLELCFVQRVDEILALVLDPGAAPSNADAESGSQLTT
jgi:ATP-dependent Lon protease